MLHPDVLSAFLLWYLSPKTETPAIPLGVYQHYKGGLYMVTETCIHTETQETMVRYRGPTGTWLRPLYMFTEEIETEQGRVPRFRLIAEIKNP